MGLIAKIKEIIYKVKDYDSVCERLENYNKGENK